MNQTLKNSLVTALLAVVAATASSLSVSYVLLRNRVPGVPEPKALTVRAIDLLTADRAVRGEAGSPYTLVEFMDYQCPPC